MADLIVDLLLPKESLNCRYTALIEAFQLYLLRKMLARVGSTLERVFPKLVDDFILIGVESMAILLDNEAFLLSGERGVHCRMAAV